MYSGNAGPADCAECAEDRGLDACSTYYYALKTADQGGVSDLSNQPSGPTACTGFAEISCDSGLVAARSADPAREAVELTAPSPLPAIQVVRFEYAIPIASAGAHYELGVLDAGGRRVKTLGMGPAAPGRFRAAWDLRTDRGTRVSEGVYFLRLAVAGTVVSRRIVALD